MPSTSQSPRRKRVRRYFSASAATGARYTAKLNAHSVSTARRRRGSSSSSRGFHFSPQDASDDSGVEDVHSYHHSDNEHSFHQASPDLGRGRTPLAYASLPPTPISSSPPLQTSPPAFSPSMASFPSAELYHEPPFSIWDYLREELLATDFDSHQELKWERVSNFLNMPLALEKVSSRSHPELSEELIVCAPDICLWLHRLPGLFPLHLHHSAHSVRACSMAPHLEYCHPIRQALATLPES